jgi:pulcherriminic acid synthase
MTTTYEVDDADEPLPASGYRTYEVFQRERVGETTNLLSPRELIGDEMLTDPYRLLTILREQYPCYRDWKGNRFWITRYDDVTSVFTDDANFHTRSKRWRLGLERSGRDLWDHVPVLTARAARFDTALPGILERLVGALARGGTSADLATGFAARLPLELWGAVLDLPADDLPAFAQRYWRMQRGASWDTSARLDGQAAFAELVAYVEPLLDRRCTDPGDDLISAIATLELDGNPATAGDVVATILEADHETLHGGLANMWCNLLTHPDQFEVVRSDRRQMKFAWLETLRHSPPIHSTQRFARHEVERFGRLLPDGALLELSAAAANRDPRVFADPDAFIVGRRDLCQREPRGQYRADGLPSGIAFGLGKPSIHPAVPKERPPSIYAITRDVAVAASIALLDAVPDIRLAPGAEPAICSLRLGEMHTCWHLPVAA